MVITIQPELCPLVLFEDDVGDDAVAEEDEDHRADQFREQLCMGAGV